MVVGMVVLSFAALLSGLNLQHSGLQSSRRAKYMVSQSKEAGLYKEIDTYTHL